MIISILISLGLTFASADKLNQAWSHIGNKSVPANTYKEAIENFDETLSEYVSNLDANEVRNLARGNSLSAISIKSFKAHLLMGRPLGSSYALCWTIYEDLKTSLKSDNMTLAKEQHINLRACYNDFYKRQLPAPLRKFLNFKWY